MMRSGAQPPQRVRLDRDDGAARLAEPPDFGVDGRAPGSDGSSGVDVTRGRCCTDGG